ncbi:MAG: hypothetical protein EPN85_07840 [Bacteroidetes bacterium]|nr:MAG: hypothetical protein EPN85_07840 [Bacteroidota bacterium]
MKKYWQSLDELKETTEFLDSAKNEFAENVPTAVLGRKEVSSPKGEGTLQGGGQDGFSRRDFLKVMGFSVGAVTLAACERPVNKTIPYLFKPEEITPGIANWYASTYFDGHDYCSVLVKTREGRPIKIEGNKLSKISHGGTSARVQASVLSLYDSERLKGPFVKGSETSWDKTDAEITSKLAEVSGAGKKICILSSTVISPSTKNAFSLLRLKSPFVKHVTYDAVSYYAIAEAQNNVMGLKVIPSFSFDKANVIVSFGADFLVNWLSPVEHSRQYAQGRKLNNGKKTLSKHVQFETILSLTGSNADIRVPVKPSQIGTAIINLSNEIASMADVPGLKSSGKVAEKEIIDCAKWLWANKGKSLVVCGVNDEAIQTVVAGINQMLGNYGSTIDIENHSNCHQGNDLHFADLMDDMKNGKVGALILYNSNPVYTAPGFVDAMKKVGLKISLSGTMDETASLCDYVCPDHHYLESWNDAEPKKNQFSLVQPTIAPIYNTRSAQETIMKWSGLSKPDYHAFIQSTWEKLLFPADLGFTDHWNESLHNGVAEIITPSQPSPKGKEKDVQDTTSHRLGSQTVVLTNSKDVIAQSSPPSGQPEVGSEDRREGVLSLGDNILTICKNNSL